MKPVNVGNKELLNPSISPPVFDNFHSAHTLIIPLKSLKFCSVGAMSDNSKKLFLMSLTSSRLTDPFILKNKLSSIAIVLNSANLIGSFTKLSTYDDNTESFTSIALSNDILITSIKPLFFEMFSMLFFTNDSSNSVSDFNNS